MFIIPNIDKPVYTNLSPGYKIPGMVWKLKKPLYGLCYVPYIWYLYLHAQLKKIRFTTTKEDLYIFLNSKVFMFFYVNNIITAYYPDN